MSPDLRTAPPPLRPPVRGSSRPPSPSLRNATGKAFSSRVGFSPLSGLLLAALLLALFPVAFADGLGACLARAAREQVGVTTGYDGSYVRLRYPGGDVPIDRGVCTDVVVRACRRLGVDLQKAVHDDMKRAFSSYPKSWGLSRPDPNIDHRRVPNLAVFFTRHGRALPVSNDPAAYEAGDLVAWRLPSGVPHIGIVSDRTSASRVPLVLHNIGGGAQEEDILFSHRITGHWRYRPDPFSAACGVGSAPREGGR